MAVTFDQIPASIRKPGKYVEFNTKLAVRTLPANAQNVLLIAPMAATGATAEAYTPYALFDDVTAVTLFGESVVTDMFRAAVRANPYVRVSCMALPATGGSYATALAGVFGGNYQVFAIGSNATADLTALRSHLDAIAHPMEQRGAVGASAFKGTAAAGGVLTAALNSGRITVAWLKNAPDAEHKIAAAYAAVIAGEEDPARPLNTLALDGITPNAIVDRAGRVEQEVALVSGLTPLEVGPGERVQIVRAITTYTKNAAGGNDISLLDLTTIRTLDYVRMAVNERWTLRFPREKKLERTRASVRSETLDVLYKIEELEIVQEVDANKNKLTVDDNLQDSSRFDVVIPADVVNGLHVLAGRIDLYL